MATRLWFLAGLLLAPLAAAQSVPCSPAWQPTFGVVPGPVYGLVGHDDGSGPALFAAGYFPVSPATKYLGSVAYAGSPGLPNPTIVRVATP